MKILSLAAQREEYAPMIGVIERMFENVQTDSNGTPVCAKYKIKFLNKDVSLYSPTSKRRIDNGIGPISKTFSEVDEMVGFEHPFEWINSESIITPEFWGDNSFDIIQKVHIMFLLGNDGMIIPITDVKWEDVIMFNGEASLSFLTVSRSKNRKEDLEFIWN